MAERAVTLGSRILVVAALETTLPSTLALLHDAARAAGRTIHTMEVRCPSAWSLFQAGDRDGYATAVAQSVRPRARDGDVVVLAQASMAPAVELLSDLEIPVLASPELGVRAALDRLRRLRAGEAL
jgi:hypothetical protein